MGNSQAIEAAVEADLVAYAKANVDHMITDEVPVYGAHHVIADDDENLGYAYLTVIHAEVTESTLASSRYDIGHYILRVEMRHQTIVSDDPNRTTVRLEAGRYRDVFNDDGIIAGLNAIGSTLTWRRFACIGGSQQAAENQHEIRTVYEAEISPSEVA